MTELQNDRMTVRTKTICPPIFDLGGIKNLIYQFFEITIIKKIYLFFEIINIYYELYNGTCR